MKIGKHDTDQEVLVVAEIGNNHEGNVEVAKKLVREAAGSGAQAVKFQTYRTDFYISRNDVARYERLRSFELSRAHFVQLAELTHSLGLLFISTPFDLESARFLEDLVDAYKISSGDIDFYPLIDVVASTPKPVIMSTGAADLVLVRKAVDQVRCHRSDEVLRDNFALLHCVSCYPTPPQYANLRSIPFLARQFPFTVGYSDHTLGLDAALHAVGLGARILEKHFTLSKTFSDFRDHAISADPDELKELIQRLKIYQDMLGVEEKTVLSPESGMLPLIRRSIVAAKPLSRGHRLSGADLTWIRAANGLHPGQESILIGRRLKCDAAFGTPLKAEDVE